MLVAPASMRQAFSPRGSIGDSVSWWSVCAPTGCFSSGATLIFTFHLALRALPHQGLLPLGLCATLFQDFEALLDDRKCLHKVALESDEDVRGVLVGAVHGLLGLCLRPVEHVLRARLGLADDRLILQQERCLFLSCADDLLGLLARLREHAVALLVDP